MTLNDTLANVYSLILNYEKIGKKECTIKPSSKVIKENLKILQNAGYIGEFKVLKDDKGDMITINLLGRVNNCGVVKPRHSVKSDGFEKFEKRFLPSRDMGIMIVSTSKGIMTHEEAKKKKIGGKLLAYCY